MLATVVGRDNNRDNGVDATIFRRLRHSTLRGTPGATAAIGHEETSQSAVWTLTPISDSNQWL